jgi:hypothetical protein
MYKEPSTISRTGAERYHKYHKEKHRNFDAIEEVGLEVSTKKTNYLLLSCHQNAGQCHNKVSKQIP